MSEDALKVVATTALHTLISSRRLNIPVTSLDLLTSVMSTKLPSALLPDSQPTPKFRLTDLSRFERIIEELSNTWPDGYISFSRDEATKRMMVWELGLHSSGLARPLFASADDLSGLTSRKRKRVIDEDADSAAGDDEATFDDEDVVGSSASTLSSLNVEMREVYMILQKSTAKGRLLAEQVRILFGFYSISVYIYHLSVSFEGRTVQPNL